MTAPRPGPAGRRAGWVCAWVPLGLLVLLAAAVTAYLAAGRDRVVDPGSLPTAAAQVSSSDLAGEWSGEATLTDCGGLEDADCSGSRSLTLRIDCSAVPCEVTPVDREHGSPPLRFEDGRYRASGPVPPDVAPTCGGVPTTSALWRLEIVAGGGRLGGTYGESTIQGFDCGATFRAWEFVLDRG